MSRTGIRLALVALLFLFAMVAAPVRLTAADESKHETAASSEAKTSGEHKEAEADETEAFKHSGAVQWIAQKTGLSLEGAYWLCVVLNFAVIGGVVFWALKKNLPAMFRNRTASIQQAMAEAKAASEDANRRLAEIESRLSRLDGEISEMRNSAEKEAAAEEARVKEATSEDIRKVVESAEQEIAAAAKSAQRELRAYTANLVVSLAEKQIKVTPETDQSLLKSFAQRLSTDASRKDAR